MKINCKLGLWIVVVLGFAAIGCGGSGGGGGNNGSNGNNNNGGNSGGDNPYVGTYVGNFVDQSSFIGPFTMTVSSSGAVAGRFDYTPLVGFSGTIDSTGKGSVTDTNGTFNVQLSSAGKSVLAGGIGTATNGAFFTTVTNPTGKYSGFAGSWFGTVHNNTTDKTGIITVTIGQNGSNFTFGGIDLFDVNGTPTLEEVTGTVTSAGELSYTVDGVTVTGKLTVSNSNGTITGSLTESDKDTATITLQEATQ